MPDLRVVSDVPDTGTPGQRIQSVAHGFRLCFSGLGHQRKLEAQHYEAVAEELDTSVDSIGLHKFLYDNSFPAISALNKAKSQAKREFDSATLPFPELAVRLFPVHSEEPEERNAEIRGFCQRIRNKLAEYAAAKEHLKEQWPAVIEHCRGKLRATFRDSDYPEAGSLDAVIKARFEPYNFDLPVYLQYVDPAEYRRQVQQLGAKFEQAARMQEAALSQAVCSSLETMLNSLRGYHDGRQKRFSGNTIQRVLAALSEFRSSQQSYGILENGELSSAFSRLERIVGSDMPGEDIPNLLKASANVRGIVLEQAGDVLNTIHSLMENRPRRQIVREELAA